jgi:hypothetical protein
MTRINSAINPRNLTDEHLLAEHIEIKRIPNAVVRDQFSAAPLPSQPAKFTLGKGHVTFFRDKLAFLYRRYQDIYKECWRRDFQVKDYSESFEYAREIAPKMWNDYTPTLEEYGLLVERIEERITESPKSCFRYYGRILSKFEAINLLKDSKYE